MNSVSVEQAVGG